MKLFLGLIFVLLDVEIPAGTVQIGLLPDFIGYFLLMRGLEEREDPRRHLAFGLMLVSLAVYAAGFLDPGSLVFWCVELAAEIGLLFLLRRIPGKGTKELFPVLCCIRILAMLLGWLPLVGTVCAVANAVVAVCFLAAAYQTLVKER